MATLRTFADLSPYRAAVEQRKAAATPEGQLAMAIQEAVLEKNLQATNPNSPENQLALAIQQANLRKLQQPQVFEVNGSLVTQDPTAPGGYKSVFTAPATVKTVQDLETQAGILQRQPDGSYKNVFPFDVKSPFTQQQVVSLTDPTDVRFAMPSASGQPPAGYQFAKAIPPEMKISERISSVKDLRQAHDETQSKLLYFGKGETPGVYGIKKKLDAVLQPVGFDFSKLNPQAKTGFVFAANKLRDPTSATLLAEARQIAGRAGVLDRFNAFVANFKEGDDLPDQVAKDIYQVVTQTDIALKSDYLNDLPYFSGKVKDLGESLQALGVPKSFIDELDKAPSNSPKTPPGAPAIPPGMKLQKNSVTGATRLVPQ